MPSVTDQRSTATSLIRILLVSSLPIIYHLIPNSQPHSPRCLSGITSSTQTATGELPVSLQLLSNSLCNRFISLRTPTNSMKELMANLRQSLGTFSHSQYDFIGTH